MRKLETYSRPLKSTRPTIHLFNPTPFSHSRATFVLLISVTGPEDTNMYIGHDPILVSELSY